MARRRGRKELRNPDPIVATLERGLAWIESHAKLVAALLLVAIAAGGIAWGMQASRTKRIERLGARFAEIQADYDRMVLGEVEADWAGLLERLEELYEDSDGTPVRLHTLFYLLHAHLEAGDVDAAIGVGHELREAVSDAPELQAATLYLLSRAYAYKGDLKTAYAFLQQAEETPLNPLGPVLEQERNLAQLGRIPPDVAARFLPPRVRPATDAVPAPKRVVIPLDQP